MLSCKKGFGMVITVNPKNGSGYFKVEGSVPIAVMGFLTDKYGKDSMTIDGESDYVNPFEMDWFKELAAEETPGGNLKFYRTLCKMKQAELAEKLGTTKQVVSMMERNKRPISKNMAKALAKIFKTSVARFIL